MGDRAQIEIRQPHGDGKTTTSIFLYTHYAGGEVHTRLADALRFGKDRWNDPSYITRIIFNGLQRHARNVTGYGISFEPHDTDKANKTPSLFWADLRGVLAYPANYGVNKKRVYLMVEYKDEIYFAEDFVFRYDSRRYLTYDSYKE